MKYREYSYTSKWADGTTHTDTVYVPHPEPKQGCNTCGWTSSSYQEHTCGGPLRTLTMPRNDNRTAAPVYDVQDYPSQRLALMLDRQWAARWLRTRRIVGRPEATTLTTGVFYRRTTEYVPNMPVDAYAEAGKVVLHGEDMGSRYGYGSGETADGVRYTEQRLDVGSYDDFHLHTECEEHGTGGPACLKCGGRWLDGNKDCDEPVMDESCEQCLLIYDCDNDVCDCISKLEQCTLCNRDLGDEDTVWLCLDGGEFVCPEHIVHDERPDALFKRVGGVRGAELPAFAWPGGYTILYSTRDNATVCAECASKVETSDPAVEADIDEEMDCVGCGHAQLEHRSRSADLAAVWTGTLDVGPCDWDETREDPFGNEVYVSCGCDDYFPPICDDCSLPIDPALREWWAQKTGKVTA